MKEELYDINLASTAINFSETIGEIYDELNDEELNELLLQSLEIVGYTDIDITKLNKSIHHYFTEGQEEDIYNSEGYAIEFPEF